MIASVKIYYEVVRDSVLAEELPEGKSARKQYEYLDEVGHYLYHGRRWVVTYGFSVRDCPCIRFGIFQNKPTERQLRKFKKESQLAMRRSDSWLDV